MSVGAQGVYVGTGIYKPEPATLRQLREAMAADVAGRKLPSIVSALRRKGYTVSAHETASTPPRGYQADHPRIELLKMKDIHAGRTFGPPVLSSPKALAHVKKAMTESGAFQCLAQDVPSCGSLDPPGPSGPAGGRGFCRSLRSDAGEKLLARGRRGGPRLVQFFISRWRSRR